MSLVSGHNGGGHKALSFPTTEVQLRSYLEFNSSPGMI
jgi:hypothetical protein